MEEEAVINSNNEKNKQQTILRDKILTNAKQKHGQMFLVKSDIIGGNIVKSN